MTRLLPNRVALYAFILTLTGGLTACHQSIAPTEEELAGTCEQAVRITAEVSPFGGAPAGTRANVDGKVYNEQIDDWQPRFKPGTGGEVRISRLFLIVTKRDSPKIERLIYYTDPAYNGKLSGTNIEAKYLTIDSAQPGIVSMELSLLPGDYTFYLIANSKALENRVKDYTESDVETLTDLQKVVSPNTSFVAEESQTGSYEYDFPIIGMGELSVPATMEPGKQVELSPEIPMERLFARVDLSLTTAKDKGLTDYLSEDSEGKEYRPSDYKLHKLNVLAHDITRWNKYWYPLLPVPGEYTSLPAGLPRASNFKAPSISLSTPANPNGMEDGSNRTESQAWQQFVNTEDEDKKEGGLRILWQQPLFYTSIYKNTEDKAFHLYLPAIYLGQVTDKDKSIRLELQFKKLDGSGEILTYRIPIHNEKGAKDYYSIRRNTIYDIDLTFYGRKIVVKQSNAEYIVDTWEDQPVDIPW